MDYYDLAIVGGGIIGASILHEAMHRFPKLKIALFDRSLAGAGASLYCPGLSVPFIGNKVKKNISYLGMDRYKKYQHPLDIIYVIGKNNLDNFLMSYGGEALVPVNASQLESLKTYFPDLNIGNDKAVLVSADGHYADVYELVKNIIDDARAQADIFESTEILEMDVSQSVVRLNSANRSFLAKKVIFSMGPWSTAKFLGKTRNKKIVAFHLKNIKLDQKAPCVFFYDEDAFLLPLYQSGHWLLSYRCKEWDVLPSTDLFISQNDVQDMNEVMKNFIPDSIKKICGGRVFCDAYTENKEPVIEYLNQDKSAIICSGFSGAGYHLAALAANRALNLSEIL